VFEGYDAFSLGEGVGISPANANLYVGEEREELDLIYHFDHLVLGHGPGGRYDPVPFSLVDFKQIFQKWYDALGDEGWAAVCLDNHDFPRMVSRFANDGTYRVEAAKLLITMLTTQPGTLCIYQGSEIGMTNVAFPSSDDYQDVECKNYWREFAEGKSEAEQQRILALIQEHGRDNVRTPIQWDDSKHAGFTTGEPWLEVNPNYTEINVAAAEQDPRSILHYYREVLAFRREHRTLVYGSYEVLDENNEEVFAYRRKDEAGDLLVMLNFSDEATNFALPAAVKQQGWQVRISNQQRDQQIPLAATLQLAPWEALIATATG